MINQEILELYAQKLSLREIGEIVGIHPQTLRKDLIKAGLAIKMKDRAASLEAYYRRHGLTVITNEEPDIEVDTGPGDPYIDDSDMLRNKVTKLEHSLQHARNELNYHRATKRKGVVNDSVTDHFAQVVRDVAMNIDLPVVHIAMEQSHPSTLPDWGLLAVMSDIHLGECVGEDVPDNTYNYEIAQRRMDKFVDKIINNHKQSKNLVIADLKDILKGVIHGGMWETEGSVIESIARAVEMYVGMLTKFTAVYDKIEIYSTGSNHERLTEYITTTNKHLDYGRLIDMMLQQVINAKGWDGITLHSTDNGYNMVQVNGANIIMMHGDTLRTYKPTITTSRSKLQDVCLQVFGVPYKYAISGHTHEFVSCTNQYGGMNIVNGTMVGNTSYGMQSGFAAITPSQTILFIEQDGSLESIKVVQFNGST